MKKIKIELEVCDALHILGFLGVSIDLMSLGADSPDDYKRVNTIIRLQNNINECLMKQVSMQDIEEAVALNKQ